MAQAQNKPKEAYLFQFHIGAIKIAANTAISLIPTQFQFHIGAIKIKAVQAQDP